MNDKPRGFAAADARLLAAITLHTRARPDLFAAGLEFLERTFTFRAIRERKERRMREALVEAEKGEPTVYLAHLKDDFAASFGPDNWEAKHGHRYLPQRTMIEWIVNRDPLELLAHLGSDMSEEHAQAALLIATFFWDRSATPNPSLPRFMQRIPWGTPESTEDTDFLAHRWVWIREADHARVMETVEAALTRVLTFSGIDLRALPTPSSESTLPVQPAEAAPKGIGRPSEAKAYAGFRFACLQRPELSAETPGPEHHEFLRENHPNLLHGSSRANFETWCTLARRGRKHVEGPIRGTAKTTARSVVRMGETD